MLDTAGQSWAAATVSLKKANASGSEDGRADIPIRDLAVERDFTGRTTVQVLGTAEDWVTALSNRTRRRGEQAAVAARPRGFPDTLAGSEGVRMARVPRVRRKQKLGFSFRFAVAILWPPMRTLVKWDRTGTDRLAHAEGGIIVAPNHISWFDPFVVAYTLWEADRPPRFLGKESVFRIPFFGRILTGAGQIPVYRETAEAVSAVRDALTALESGECVVMYPEGTITRDRDLWPMTGKTGAVRVALASGRPLFPMAQWGAQDVMRPYRKELRLLPRKTIRIAVGPAVDLSDLAGLPLDTRTLSIASDRVMDAITALVAELRGEQPPATRLDLRKESKRQQAPPADEPLP